MAELKKGILQKSEFKPYLWWRYNDDVIFLWEYGGEKSKSSIGNIKKDAPN